MYSNTDAAFEYEIQYIFKDKNILDMALTHPSCMAKQNYERLEFLGDAVIELIVSDLLYTNYNNYSEGMLTQKRSEIVCSKSLAEIARTINLGSILRLGKGEEQTGGREKTTILENALESIIGAIYIDGGFNAAKNVTCSLFKTAIENIMGSDVERDYKSQLQELVQKKLKKEVKYLIAHKDGPPHNLTFYVSLMIGDKFICDGVGTSKKEAEQNAAKFALKDFNKLIK